MLYGKAIMQGWRAIDVGQPREEGSGAPEGSYRGREGDVCGAGSAWVDEPFVELAYVQHFFTHHFVDHHGI